MDDNPSEPPGAPSTFDDDVHHSLEILAHHIDSFIDSLSSITDKPNTPAPDIPCSAEAYVKKLEAQLQNNDSTSLAANPLLVDSFRRLGKMNTILSEFFPREKTSTWLTKTNVILHKVMVLLEDELRNILEEFATGNGSAPVVLSASDPSDKTPKTTKHFSSFHNHLHRRQDSDSSSHYNHQRTSSNNSINSITVYESETYPVEDDDFPAIPDETVAQMRAIAAAMVSSGYESECCQVYSLLRRSAFKFSMKKRGFQKLSIDEVGKMSWEQIEPSITAWNRVVRHTALVIYPREYNLCDDIFSDYPSVKEGIMKNLARAVVILFLNFVEAIAMTKRAAERLFKVLEMYESLMELGSALEGCPLSKEADEELQLEIAAVRMRIGEAIIAMFADLKDSIKNDPAKNTAPGGGVQPLIRYTMNYLRYASEFKDSLELIFQNSSDNEKNVKALRSPFTAELLKILGMLDANLEAKSKQYKDASLRCVFLMNNGRYILQKIKESEEMHELLGRVASRKRSTELRAHHKSYQRETWGKVLQCLTHEGLQVNGKVHKPILKERFKSFNQMLDEIHKSQGAWVIGDEQLKSELRVSVSSVMIPAYRSFVARFGQTFTAGRQTEKYIKYQPEDIESTIEELFDGNPNSTGKTKK